MNRVSDLRNGRVKKVSTKPIDTLIVRRASEAGIGPKVFRVTAHEVVMERLTQQFTHAKFGKQMPELIVRMLEAGFFHNDIHSGNLMAKRNRLYMIDFDNATRIEDMTQSAFDKAMVYHSRYVDETHRHRHALQFTPSQLRRIAAVRARRCAGQQY